MQPTRIIAHGLSGFGPRNAQFVLHLALVLLSLRDRLDNAKEKGIAFIIQVTAFEKQTEAGTGNAFQTDCDAAANTGVIMGLPSIRDLDKVDPAFVALANHAQNVATRLGDASAEILADLEKRNPAAAMLFKSAFLSNGKINTSIACTTRGEWGRVFVANMRSALDYIRNNMPELVVDIHYGHVVTGVDFTNNLKPRLLVSKGDEAPTSHEFDFITLAHGTPLVSPVSTQVSTNAYSLTPNHDTLKAYLGCQGLLDAEGFILPGKSIALTGVSLGAYDYATLLLPFLRGFRLSESNPAGFEFAPTVARDYQGLITFVSHSERGPAPPRLAPNHTWQGKLSLLSTEEMHALRLYRQLDWISPAYILLRACVAYSVGKVPSEVGVDRTIPEYMKFYSAENDNYLVDGSSTSETALLRAGFVAFSIGSGLEADPTSAEQSLARKTPLTREGRVGWPMFSASGVEISSLAKTNSPDNAAFFRHWDQLHHFASASPAMLQNAIAQLFRHGIATHQSATFDQISLTASTGKVTLTGRVFDALLAPKTICREADPVLVSLMGKVKEICAGVPEYGKGMYFQTVDGKSINAFDAGMGGWGARSRGRDGQSRVVGEQWNETNNYNAAGTFSTHHALLTVILAVSLVIDPEEPPLDTVAELYQNTIPSLSAFRSEIRHFEGVWRGTQEKVVFVQLCEELARGNPTAFASAIDYAPTADLRNTFIKQQDSAVQSSYAQKLREIPPFDPPRLPSQYEKRFVGYTKQQLETMLDEMFEMILKN